MDIFLLRAFVFVIDVVIYLDSPDQLPLSRLNVGWREFQVYFQRVQDQ